VTTRCRIVLGVDGGGTKTDLAVATLDGECVARRRVGGTNHESLGIRDAVAELERGVRLVLADAGASPDEVVSSVFGLAGVDWASDEVALDAAIAGFGLGGRRLVCNDSAVALRAGTSVPWGIVSSIGTGAVVAGVDPSGRRFRSMSVGWGEPCGAASLARDALHAIAAAHHRTAPPTVLTELVLAELGVGESGVGEVTALFEALSRGRLRPDGRLAPLVTAAAAAGDEVARAIVDRSAVAHAAMVVGTAAHLDLTHMAFELVTAGGVHAAGGAFVERFAVEIATHCPNARIVPLRRPPVDGAVDLALERLTPPRG
jgi:N-acetylglucosamine kinase-like BadF-type ATPase